MNTRNAPGDDGGPVATVERWECPYCRSFSEASVSAVRTHVGETDDETHSTETLDRHVPGYDGDDALVAVWPTDGVELVPIHDVDSVPGATEVVADAGAERLGVDHWVCPHCEYTNDTEQGIRSHVTGTTDAAHAGKSGWNPDRPIEGFDGDTVVARITPSADGGESVVVPAGETEDDRTTAYSSGEGIRGEKKVRLINAWLADPDAHYSALADAADTTPRYAHRVKNKLEDGEIAEGAVMEVADEELQATFAARLGDEDTDTETTDRSSDPAQALAAAGVDPSRERTAAGEPAVPLSEVERVRDMMEMYRREAEFEADSATGDDGLAARAETKEFVASQAIEMLERAIETAERDH
jgi:hypothetical protein